MNDLNEGDGNGILVGDGCSCVLLMLVGGGLGGLYTL